MKFFLMILVGVSLSVLSAAGQASEDGLERVRLQLKWKHQFQFAGYYAAIEKGFYREKGLDVELIEPEIGADAVDVVLEGKAEFGISNSEIVQRIAQGDPIVALAVIYQHSPLVLLSLQESGIESLHDLAGKTLMIEPGAADLLAMFRAEGIDTDQIKMVPHTFSVDSLIDGTVAGLSAYVSDEPFDLRQRGYHPIQMTPRAVGVDFYGDNIFTTRQQIEEHPGRVEAFRDASLMGWDYALRNPEEIIDLILSKYSQRKTREQLQYEAMKTMQLVRADLVEVGYMNPGRWNHIIDVFQNVGLIDRSLSPNEFLYRFDRPFPWRTFFFLTLGLGSFGIVVTLIAYRLYRLKSRLEEEVDRRREVELSLRESERFFRSVYEGAPLAFVLWDKDHRVTRWNRTAEKFFGWKEEEVLGRSFLDFLIPKEEAEKVASIDAETAEKGTSSASNWNLCKDGTRIFCQWHNVIRYDGEGNMLECQSIAVDSTLQHEREQRLRSDRDRAEFASENKGRFLASVSHEIRNPLGAIISFAELIREDLASDEKREMVDTIIASGESLIRILNDLIDNEKLQAGEMEIVPTSLRPAEVVEKMVKLYAPVAREKGLELKFVSRYPEEEAVLDRVRIEQIVTNLLSNSIKFTEKGWVEVSVEKVSEEGLPILIMVRDSGIGMSEEESKNIFQLYGRGGTAQSRRFAGTGVGLAVCRQLVDLMGGRILVESEPGVGSVFRVWLPSRVED